MFQSCIAPQRVCEKAPLPFLAHTLVSTEHNDLLTEHVTSTAFPPASIFCLFSFSHCLLGNHFEVEKRVLFELWSRYSCIYPSLFLIYMHFMAKGTGQDCPDDTVQCNHHFFLYKHTFHCGAESDPRHYFYIYTAY